MTKKEATKNNEVKLTQTQVAKLAQLNEEGGFYESKLNELKTKYKDLVEVILSANGIEGEHVIQIDLKEATIKIVENNE
jgi:endonuclease III-like uncharacterized protein